MFDKLKDVEARYETLEAQLLDPGLANNPKQYQQFAKEKRQLEPVIEAYRRYVSLNRQLQDNRELLLESDPSIREMAKEEIPALEVALDTAAHEVRLLLLPKDPLDEKNIMLEIRAGTGGEEAALFAADLFRMYTRYAERKGWKVDILSSNPTGIGGFKEIIALISGNQVYSFLKYESGTHRVQRVPATEASGRVHTSAITVAVMPEAEDIDLNIDEKDLRVDIYRAGGHGGQGVNTTDSAIRITHIPTGLVVVCQDERSQHKNKAKAMKVLKTRLLELEREKADKERSDMRKTQVGSGDRSEKIRTYNFPQGRFTDHRIHLTVHQLQSVLDGDLDDIINALRTHYQAEALKSQGV